jgi:predicted methyltransferase
MSIRHSVGVALKRVLYEGFGRDRWQRPERVISALGLRPGMVVADLGSGTGYFTLRFARAVGPSGRVFAVDTDRQLLDAISERAREAALNVETVEASEDGPRLPAPVDLVFLSNVYHHLPTQTPYFAAVRSQLAPDGRVAIVESVAQGFFRRLFGHATDPAVIRRAMGEAGFEVAATHDFVDRHSFQIFRQAPREQPFSDRA